MANIFELVGSILINDTNAQQSLTELERRAESAKDKLGKIGDNVGKAGAVVSGAVGVAGGLLYTLGVQGEDAGVKLQNGLGLTAEEAEKLKGVAKGIYNDGFGESLDQVTDDLILVKQNLAGVNDADLGTVTKGIQGIAELTKGDVNEATVAVSQLMTNFGISHTEAMDMIVAGTQQGLNKNGDFLDSINEYSPQFSAMGMSSDKMFAIFKAGADGGAMSIDKVADAVKEFNVRAMDGSKTTAEGFKAIGMDAEEMGAKIAGGGAEGERAFQATVGAIMALEDPVAQQNAGVALFGTQWEDLQAKAVGAMSEAGTGLENVDGAMQRLNETTAGSSANNFAETMRGLKDALTPLAEAVMKLVNDNLPAIQNFATSAGAFLSGMNPHILKLTVAFTAVVGVLGLVAVAVAPVITAIGTMIPIFVQVWGVVSKVITVIRSWGAVLGVIAGGPVVWIIAGIVAVIAIVVLLWNKFEGFRNFVKAVWDGIKSIISGAISIIMSILSGLASFIGSVLTGAFNVVKSAWSAVWSILSGIISGGISVIKGLIGGFKSVASGVANIWDSVTGVWSSAWNGLKGIVEGAMNYVNELLGYAMGSISGIIAGAKEVMSWGTKVWDKITGGKGQDKAPSGMKNEKPAKNANGTKNFEGGWTVVGEQGRELVQLPQGSRIHNNPETEGIMEKSGKGGVTQHITIVSPKSNAVEIARKVKQASRQLAME